MGSTMASQAVSTGSTPVARTKGSRGPEDKTPRYERGNRGFKSLREHQLTCIVCGRRVVNGHRAWLHTVCWQRCQTEPQWMAKALRAILLYGVK